MRAPLDMYDDMPRGMRSYLRHYGWHFNRKACEFACEKMKRQDSNGDMAELSAYNKEEVENILRKAGVKLKNDVMYDSVYVANMCKADCLHSSIPDDLHLAKFVSDTIDDVDAGEGEVMRCWYAKCVARGCPVEWDDFL